MTEPLPSMQKLFGGEETVSASNLFWKKRTNCGPRALRFRNEPSERTTPVSKLSWTNSKSSPGKIEARPHGRASSTAGNRRSRATNQYFADRDLAASENSGFCASAERAERALLFLPAAAVWADS